MSPELPSMKSHHLPAVTPDLVVAESAGDEWQILQISPRLATLLDIEVREAKGRRLSRLFRKTVPALGSLAREAVERETPLTSIPVRFSDFSGAVLSAGVHPGGLTDDYRGRTVSFFFHSPVGAPEAVTRHGMVGASPAIREVFRKIDLYAASDAAVVITGETGTGKELVARALHEESLRTAGPYVAVNCSAISEELLESELFGHEKGAFTGAVRTHRGRFERAHRGTLFLDEIGDMPLHTQSKLLRVLETGRIERVGAEEEQKIDVRIVCATNVPLEQAVARGQFRADLYHRVSVLRIHMPPLRERSEDIPLLADFFLRQFNQKYGRRIEKLTSEAIELLRSYLWPGNIRELRNVLERVYVETQAEVIGARAFAEWIRERREFTPGAWNLRSLQDRPREPLVPPYPFPPGHALVPGGHPAIVDAELLPTAQRHSTRPVELDRDEIRRAYKAAEGNLTRAARLLGVHRATLYRYLDRLNLSREDLES